VPPFVPVAIFGGSAPEAVGVLNGLSVCGVIRGGHLYPPFVQRIREVVLGFTITGARLLNETAVQNMGHYLLTIDYLRNAINLKAKLICN
jgi:hypothetical protein